MDGETSGTMGGILIDRFGKAVLSPYVLALSLLVLASILRLFGIGDAPLRTDEVWHLLAGRSWADHGTLAMGDGAYTRARYYTMATGEFFQLFGPTPGAGRALAAIGGILLVIVAALWVRRIGGAIAGWTTGILLCFGYTGIMLSQFARFYTWHALGVFMLAIAVYAIVTQGGRIGVRKLILWSAAALIALLVSLHLQDITMLMVLALALWVGLYLLLSGRFNFIFRSRFWLAAVALAILLGIAVVWHERHRVIDLWHDLRGAAAWSEEHRDDFGYYVTVLGHWLSWLFYLLPIAMIVAWRRYREPVLFCATILVVCLTLHSIAGMKAIRYIYYLFPFIFAIWGFVVAVLGPPLIRGIGNFARARAGRVGQFIAIGVVALATASAALVVTEFRFTAAAAARTLRTGSPVLPIDYGMAREEVHWTPHLASLRALQHRGLFITTDSVRTLYYLGDFDVLLNRSELSDVGTKEFTLDRRTGKHDISTGGSIEILAKCYPKGALLISNARWRSAQVTDDASDAIERVMTPVKLPPELRMRGYIWEHAPDSSPACRRIQALIGKP